MRRWEGFKPSRASGRARETITDIEYARKDWDISSATLIFSIFSFCEYIVYVRERSGEASA
jgi:hypothetical protein